VLLFADLDRMKDINDRFGHAEGDRALQEMAAVLRASFRNSDLIARLGGDEFAVLAIGADPECARAMANRNAEPDRAYPLAVSVGCACHGPGGALSLEELLSAADAAMYRAKQSARQAGSASSLSGGALPVSPA
jgi:diguanylate cyclase (GGDEF)-like protein